ncbi:DNA cytosine methyltransferase [Candidatus Kaiserbacteria bacterium]|nr:DNA cytosine methyltransferase [Candidatus Kaiserbacteria bacterium]
MEESKTTLTFVDLFSGIGGFHLGIEQAAKDFGLDARCELAVDINEKARKTYTTNFPGTRLLNDVTDDSVKNSIPEDVDIICGGFPCQPFSLAGKKLGIADHRGTLFIHIIDILRRKRPKVVFLENVRNLLKIQNDDGTYAIDTILAALESAGYPVQGTVDGIEWKNYRVYRATDFGLPTHRPRVYFVGFRSDLAQGQRKFQMPEPSSISPATLAKYFRTLSKDWDQKVLRYGWPKRVGATLRVGGVGSGYRQNLTIRDRRNWDSYILYENNEKRRKHHKITVTEAKAMMGFPVDFKFPEQISDPQAMKQLGNSVAVPVIKAVADSIIRTLYGGSDNS